MTVITRTNAYSLIDEQVSKEILQGAVAKSAVLAQGKRLPNMTSDKTSMPVLDMLPLAYFVNGDTGRKGISKMAWDKKTLHAEEIAVIIPIPESVLEDASYDIWAEIRPRIEEAFGTVIDGAILLGVNKPSTWRADLVSSIRNASKGVTPTTDLYTDIFGENGVIAKVETAGFAPNGVISGVELKAKLRNLRDDNKQPIFKTTVQDGTRYALDGHPNFFVENGVWDNTKCQMIMGDFNQLVYATRQDITYKVLSEAIIQDPSTGDILFNLAQQDMVALRVVMRLGWEIPNPINILGGDSRFPFAMLEPSSLPTQYNITFTVTDSSSDAVANAKVTYGGQTLKTNASGIAVFKSNNGTFPYTVKKDGVATKAGTVVVAGSAVAVSVINF